MTIEQAFIELLASEDFKAQSKQRDSHGGKLRSYVSRYRSGILTLGSMVELLLANGYKISANKEVKKTKGK